MIEIKHRYTGRVIRTVKGNSLQDANFDDMGLVGANLSNANLSNVSLRRVDLNNALLIYAILRQTDFYKATLINANLTSANFHSAQLVGANFSNADLHETSFYCANLCIARFHRANLCSASFISADLRGAYFRGADLRGADFTDADLSHTDLMYANLCGVKVNGTVLDPANKPNGDVEQFERCGKYVIGYRTRNAGHIGEYLDGRTYNADWFSTCEVTECHPGLYIWPTLDQAVAFSGQVPMIRVYAKSADVHKTPTKWRCRAFEVIGEVFTGE